MLSIVSETLLVQKRKPLYNLGTGWWLKDEYVKDRFYGQSTLKKSYGKQKKKEKNRFYG